MVRKYRKSRKSRSDKRLKDKYIYGNKSAKAQARQIAALRNKVNRCYKVCKPETRWKSDGIQSWKFTNAASPVGYEYKIWGDASLNIQNGLNDISGSGDFIRSLSLTYMIAGEYSDSISTMAANEGRGCVIRMVVIQAKRPKPLAEPPVIDDIIDGYVSSGDAYNLNSVRSLKRGITDEFKVLCDKRWILTYTKNQLATKFRVKVPNNLKFQGSNYNRVYVCMLATALRWDSEQTYEAKVSIESKYVYTDN